ncbi:MAG TPA: DUF4386 family protein [Symbiobacteriaceae bacterium]|nr:DUF4386 family protein [Symbiobacteriaceae bacterium]
MLAKRVTAEAADSSDKSLYRFGGVAAVIVALLLVGEVVLFALRPQPGTVSDWFMLFQSNKLMGILEFWGLEIPMYFGFILAFLALYTVLRKANKGLVTIAAVLALLGIAVFLATNNPVSMLRLSDQYAAATTDAERATFLAAGETLLVNTSQRAVGGFNMGLFLVTVAGLIFAAVMLRSDAFTKAAAYVGILAHIFALADYLRQALTASPIVALLVILPGAVLLVTWFAMVGRRLYQLGRQG